MSWVRGEKQRRWILTPLDMGSPKPHDYDGLLLVACSNSTTLHAYAFYENLPRGIYVEPFQASSEIEQFFLEPDFGSHKDN
jgi:hypothetical protein